MIATHSTPAVKPIQLMVNHYGLQLETLSQPHKLFVVSVLSEFLRLDSPIEEVIDALDPNAIIPNHLCDALRKLEPFPRRKLIELLLYCNMNLLTDN